MITREDARAPSQEMVTTRLRPLDRSDLPHVLEIEAASFSAPWPRSAFDMALSLPTLLCVAALREERLAGYLIACGYENSVLIANVAVHPELRRLGIGNTLIEHTLEWSRRQGTGSCRLEVRESNHSAIALYRRLGFRTVAVQSGYYTHPTEDALTMLYQPLAKV